MAKTKNKLGEVMAALEDFGGSVPLAAYHLGITQQAIHSRLDNQCIKKFSNGKDAYFRADRKKIKKLREIVYK